MNWNDYEAVWKRQEMPLGASADLTNLRATFETKRRKMAGTLLVRDIVEASAGLLVAAAFAHKGWTMGKTGWPIAISVALLLGLSGLSLWERIRAKRKRLGRGVPLLVKVEADIAELHHQRRLLLHVDSWYLAPCLAAMVIFAFTLGSFTLASLARDWLLQLCCWTFVLFLYWRIRKLNDRAVRTQIEPRIAELERLHRDLVSPE